ncbi:hypothetical protein HB779_21125 (plasmid) [Phyllobacterium sp. 628]|uniref:hypothetical protein n=1 Tax=Phyllobacterium sp. 628 TaxID=2718938 RepID=UPI0016628916|nr:hypothetical protein [Phyllobacterium sp. 628]QND54426.1 hypothetical protein HB779_21125 [Phyllobacterium sp. 628]
MSIAKVLINTQSLTIELEGEDEFVRTYLDKLMPILERSKFGEDGHVDGEAGLPDDFHAVASVKSAGTAPSRKRVRSGGASGGSCRERVKKLRDAGFFEKQHGIGDIVNELTSQGFPHSINQVGAALSTMFGRNEIERSKIDKKYKYFWSSSQIKAA